MRHSFRVLGKRGPRLINAEAQRVRIVPLTVTLKIEVRLGVVGQQGECLPKSCGSHIGLPHFGQTVGRLSQMR